MFEQLKQLIQQFGQQAVVQNQDVPNEHNEAVMQEAKKSIVSGLQQAAANGKLEQMAQKSQAGQAPDANHPQVQQISNNFVQNLMTKFGISGEKAQNVANDLIPKVLNGLLKQVKTGEVKLENLIQSLSGKGPDSAKGSDSTSRAA